MAKTIQFVLAIAVLYLSLRLAWFYPHTTVALINGYIGFVRTVSYPLPAPLWATVQVLMFFLLPGFFFFAITESLAWGGKQLYRGARLAYAWFCAWRARQHM